MNKIDRQWYKTLKFLSKWTLDNAFDELKKKDPKKFKKYLYDEPWDTLHKLGHVTSINDSTQIVTSSGLELLRMFEDMRRKDLTIYISTAALIISSVAFAKSVGWI